jgi:hypothetical protein
VSAREPVAELGHEDYRIVKFTHDVELAATLMLEKLNREYGNYEPDEIGKPYQTWIRIVPCLENSYGAAEGWGFVYQNAKPHSRGAFRAVVWSR